VLEETKIFRRATLASIITSTYPMIVVDVTLVLLHGI